MRRQRRGRKARSVKEEGRRWAKRREGISCESGLGEVIGVSRQLMIDRKKQRGGML